MKTTNIRTLSTSLCLLALVTLSGCISMGGESYNPIAMISEKIEANKKEAKNREAQLALSDGQTKYRMMSDGKYTDSGEFLSPKSVELNEDRSELVAKINNPQTSAADIAKATKQMADLSNQIRSNELSTLAEIDGDLNGKIATSEAKEQELTAGGLTPPEALTKQTSDLKSAKTYFAELQGKWMSFPLNYTGNALSPTLVAAQVQAKEGDMAKK